MHIKVTGWNIVDFIDMVQREKTCMDFVSTAIIFWFSCSRENCLRSRKAISFQEGFGFMDLLGYAGCFIMYSEITKLYYRKTIGHVFTNHVQVEGTTQKMFSPVSCFLPQYTFPPLSDAGVCSEKMAAPGQKFCVLEYHTSNSVVTVQRAFRAKYAKDPPTDKIIHAQYKKFTENGCLCKQNQVVAR